MTIESQYDLLRKNKLPRSILYSFLISQLKKNRDLI